MKVNTAVDQVVMEINRGNYIKANGMMLKYRRRYGNRHFNYHIRLYIKNGMYFENNKDLYFTQTGDMK